MIDKTTQPTEQRLERAIATLLLTTDQGQAEGPEPSDLEIDLWWRGELPASRSAEVFSHLARSSRHLRTLEELIDLDEAPLEERLPDRAAAVLQLLLGATDRTPHGARPELFELDQFRQGAPLGDRYQAVRDWILYDRRTLRDFVELIEFDDEGTTAPDWSGPEALAPTAPASETSEITEITEITETTDPRGSRLGAWLKGLPNPIDWLVGIGRPGPMVLGGAGAFVSLILAVLIIAPQLTPDPYADIEAELDGFAVSEQVEVNRYFAARLPFRGGSKSVGSAGSGPELKAFQAGYSQGIAQITDNDPDWQGALKGRFYQTRPECPSGPAQSACVERIDHYFAFGKLAALGTAHCLDDSIAQQRILARQRELLAALTSAAPDQPDPFLGARLKEQLDQTRDPAAYCDATYALLFKAGL